MFYISADSEHVEVVKFTATSQRAGNKLTVEFLFTSPREFSYAMECLAELKQRKAAKTNGRKKALALPPPEDL